MYDVGFLRAYLVDTDINYINILGDMHSFIICIMLIGGMYIFDVHTFVSYACEFMNIIYYW